MNTKKNSGNRLLYHLIAIFVVMIWGGTFVNTKILIQDHGMSPYEVFVVRFVLAYFATWFISPKKLFANSWKDELILAIMGVLGGSMYFISENVAVNLTYVNNVSFIVSISPLITMLLAFMFSKDVKAKVWLILGSIIALVGVGAIIFNGQFELHLKPEGDLLALLAAVCWGVYCLILKPLSSKYDPVFITRKVFAYGVLTSLPMFIFYPWSFPLSGFMSWPVIINLAFLGLIASFACFGLWSLTIKKLGALTASNYNYLSPICTVLVSAIFLPNETMTSIAYIGSVLILVGVYLANK